MRYNKTLINRLSLFCLIALLLTACGGSSPPTVSQMKASADKQVFVNALPGDPPTLDPARAINIISITAIDMMFTGLVQLDDHLVVQPQLAQSWELGSDGLTWTFHLRHNVQFSDGTPLTSHDVAYSIDRALQPALKSVSAPSYLALIKDAQALNMGKIKTIIGDSILTPDENTVIIIANKKAAYFLETLTFPTSYVVEKRLIEKYGDDRFTDHLTEGGGAGPFIVAQYIHAKEIDFAPNPNYYGPKPQLKKVVFPFYQNADTVYEAYQAGQVSVTDIPLVHIVEARKNTAEFHQIPTLRTLYCQMNYLTKPFDNIKIRQAFALAINKDIIVHRIWKDTAIATNHIVPEGMPGYNRQLKAPDGSQSLSGNPTLARQLLQQGMREEGWSDVSQIPPIKLTYATGSQEFANMIAAMIQMWQNVLGVDIKSDGVEIGKLIDALTATANNPGGLQFWVAGWGADYPDPQEFLTLQFDKDSPFNIGNYGQNSSADAVQQETTQQLLEQADATLDQTARLQQYQQAERQLVNDVAWVPLLQLTEDFLLNPCVQGLIVNALTITPPDDWANIYISTALPCSNTTV